MTAAVEAEGVATGEGVRWVMVLWGTGIVRAGGGQGDVWLLDLVDVWLLVGVSLLPLQWLLTIDLVFVCVYSNDDAVGGFLSPLSWLHHR